MDCDKFETMHHEDDPWNQTYSWANGDKYEGLFKDGMKHGRGLYTYKNGRSYRGDYVNDKFEGYGTYTFAKGNRYEGMWKEGL